MLGADYAGIYTKERERLVMEQRRKETNLEKDSAQE
jgi:hypothetical protein